MEKEEKIPKKNAPKKVAELYKKIREKRISQRIYNLIEGYERQNLPIHSKGTHRKIDDDKSF